MRASSSVLALVLLAGCATVPGTDRLAEKDPLEGFNRAMWGVNRGVDKVVLKPVTKVYRAVTPKPARRGISNVFANLSEPWSFINNLLQGKPKRAVETLARFIINTTVGVGGLGDPATKMGLKAAPEDFGQTLAVWGVNGGPYLVLPLLAWWLARRPSPLRFFGACAAVLVFGIGLRSAVWLHDAALDPARNWYIEDIYYPSWMRLDGLLMGVMLATLRVYRPQTWARLQARSNVCLLGGVAVSCLAFWLFDDRTGLLANTIGWPLLSFGFGLLVFAGADERSLIGRWRIPGVGWIAAISYSLYLSHKIAFHLVQEALAPSLQGHGDALQFATYALATVLLGAALHYLVERPFLRWRDRRAVASNSALASSAA